MKQKIHLGFSVFTHSLTHRDLLFLKLPLFFNTPAKKYLVISLLSATIVADNETMAATLAFIVVWD